MENTIENKARFFELYSASLDKGQLQLKSLEDINEEDAILVCKKAYPEAFTKTSKSWTLQKFPNGDSMLSNRDSKFSFWISPQEFPVLDMHEDLGETEEPFSGDAACDLMRSMGYALPFYGITVEEMQEWGWLRIASE